MNRGNKGNSPVRWQNTRLEVLVKEIDSKIDSCSEHYLNICRIQFAGSRNLYIFNSLNTTEAVIMISSNLGTGTSDYQWKLAKSSSVKTLATDEFNNSAFS